MRSGRKTTAAALSVTLAIAGLAATGAPAASAAVNPVTITVNPAY